MPLTRAAVREIDRRAVEEFGIPSIVLMENAGRGATEVIHRLNPLRERVAIVCGPGNNGGDGLVIARHLDRLGQSAVVWIFGSADGLSPDAAINLRIVERMRLAQNAVSNLKSSPKGRLVLAVPPSVGTVLTVPLVKKIKNEFPNVALQVIEGFSGHILEWLIAGRIDAAVLYNSPNHPSVLTEPLADDELFLIGPVLSERVLPRAEVPKSAYVRLPRPLNSLLAAIVGLDGYLVQRLRLPFGLSIVAVVRRPAAG